MLNVYAVTSLVTLFDTLSAKHINSVNLCAFYENNPDNYFFQILPYMHKYS